MSENITEEVEEKITKKLIGKKVSIGKSYEHVIVSYCFKHSILKLDDGNQFKISFKDSKGVSI